MPWNAFITAADYYQLVFPVSMCAFLHFAILQPSGFVMSTSFYVTFGYSMMMQGYHVDRLVTISYLPLNFLVLALFVSFHNARHANIRILSGFVIFSLAMILVPTVSRYKS